MENEDKKYEPEHREADITPKPVSLAGHLLVPQGPMLVCRSCPYEHSYSIPPNMVYKGNDKEGLPILEKV